MGKRKKAGKHKEKKFKKEFYSDKAYFSSSNLRNYKKESKWISSIFLLDSKIGLGEKIIKFIIYICLRLVIRPKLWKNPKKNIKIINYTYNRIMSQDLIFIPSSIAFYIIMSFAPILTLILFLFSIDFIQDFAGDEMELILKKFIPGIGSILEEIKNATTINSIGSSVALIITLVISTWIASSGFSKLIYTQSYLFSFYDRGSYFKNRIHGFRMVLIFTMYLFVVLLANIFIEKNVIMNLPEMLRTPFRWLYLIFGLFIVIFFGFLIFYWRSPKFKIHIKNILPGTMVTTLPTWLFLISFGGISSLWNYGVYGTIGFIMYIAMASLFMTNFLFYGIITNVAYNKELLHFTLVSKKKKMRI